MDNALADATALIFPKKSELNDVLQPVFNLMQEKYPDRVLIVKMHQAEMLKMTFEVTLSNEKMIEDFFLSQMVAVAGCLGKPDSEKECSGAAGGCHG